MVLFKFHFYYNFVKIKFTKLQSTYQNRTRTHLSELDNATFLSLYSLEDKLKSKLKSVEEHKRLAPKKLVQPKVAVFVFE
jgi:hypothetical protein